MLLWFAPYPEYFSGYDTLCNNFKLFRVMGRFGSGEWINRIKSWVYRIVTCGFRKGYYGHKRYLRDIWESC